MAHVFQIGGTDRGKLIKPETVALDLALGAVGSGTFQIRSLTPSAGQTFKVGINTINTLVFSGYIRAVRQIKTRDANARYYECEVADLTYELNQRLPCARFTNSQPSSIVVALTNTFTNSFTASPRTVPAPSWPDQSWDLTGDRDLTDVFSDVAAQASADFPAMWWLTPDHTIHLDYLKNLATAPALSDTNPDLIAIDYALDLSNLATRVFAVGAGVPINSARGAGLAAIGVDDTTYFTDWTVGVAGATMLLQHGPERIAITSVKSNDSIRVTSTNVNGELHYATVKDEQVRVCVQYDDADAQNAVGSLVGGPGVFEVQIDDPTMVSYAIAQAAAQSRVTQAGSLVAAITFTTIDSRVSIGKAIGVSLTGHAAAQGLYIIDQVRFTGFDRDPKPPFRVCTARILPKPRVQPQPYVKPPHQKRGVYR